MPQPMILGGSEPLQASFEYANLSGTATKVWNVQRYYASFVIRLRVLPVVAMIHNLLANSYRDTRL